MLFHQMMHLSCSTERFMCDFRSKSVRSVSRAISATLRVLTKARFVPDRCRHLNYFPLRRACLLFLAGANVRLQKTRPLPKHSVV